MPVSGSTVSGTERASLMPCSRARTSSNVKTCTPDCAARNSSKLRIASASPPIQEIWPTMRKHRGSYAWKVSVSFPQIPYLGQEGVAVAQNLHDAADNVLARHMCTIAVHAGAVGRSAS